MISPHRRAALVAAAFVLLALAYGIANPAFEAADEIRHFRYVRYLALHRTLPPASAEASKELQAHHPPLYYIVSALVTAPIASEAGPDYAPPANPFWGFRYFEPSTDNKNQYLHAPDERWQFHGAVLIIYMGRLVSLLFGLGTVVMAYRLGLTVFPDQPGMALGAMAFVAFNPVFLHSSASMNNDTAAAFFGSWAIWQSAAVAQFGTRPWRAAALGAALGLGLISKASVAPLSIVMLAAFGADALRGKRRQAAGGLLVAVAAAGLIAGWWFARNAALTGDPMGLSDYRSAWVGTADRAQLLREAASNLPYAWTTFWARFDYGQVVLPDAVYVGWGLLCALAGAGLVRNWRAFRLPGLLIAALALLVSLAGWGALMVSVPATSNARLILQAFPALGLLAVAGWRALVPRLSAWAEWLIPVGLFAFAVAALVGFVAPAFAYPRGVDRLPADVRHSAADFEGAAEVVAYRLATDSARPGERVDVTVYWRPSAQTATPLNVFVHLVDEHGIIAAQRDTYPGLGRAPTTTWRVGETFADTYRVFIPETAYAPASLSVRVGLWNAAEGRPLVAGDSDAVTLGTIALQPRPGDVPNPASINFANRVRLIGYALDSRLAAPGGALLLTTYWTGIAPDSDYWVYAHVVGPDGRIWAIADSILLPPATQWQVGQTYSETRVIALARDTPSGQYVIELGITRILEPGQDRLKVLAEDGHEVDDHIDLARVRVAEP